MLSLNGAGILSTRRFAPEQELILRIEEISREAVVRVVGEIAVTLRRRKSHLGGDRSPAGTKGLGGSGRSSATRYDSGLVSEAQCKKVRWVEISPASGPTTDC